MDFAMEPPPKHPRSDGIVYAATGRGYDLPVIDMTHPRFAVPEDPESARTLYEACVEAERKRRRIPKLVMRLMFWSAAQKSLLVRAFFRSEAGFLDGLSTYVMKLGADNLMPPYDGPIDRRLAGSPHMMMLRLRMQQTARLTAEGLVDELAGAGAPLHLINISGGPAVDSLNALILLRRDRPDLLKRSVAIHVLDSDDSGPTFGANALAALKIDGAPLSGLDVTLRHQRYDWDEPAPLARLVRELTSEAAVIAASSEGALFEYGSDEAIVANLQALRGDERGAKLVVGSVTRADESRRQMIATTRFKLVPRGLEGFAPLVSRAGFTIVRVEAAFLSDQVLLRPS
jgi:hypothetical protein